MAEIVRQQGLDKFYTKDCIVDMCLLELDKIYKINEFDLVIEPSAGNGSFFNKIIHDKKIGLDIEPECDDVIKMNFFDFTPPNTNGSILFIGNPPFGRVSSIAIKFFNHSAKWADVIAFIIPKTFRRISVHNKLHQSFHLIHDIDIPTNPCAFIPKMSVKCCFQIWKRLDTIRNITVMRYTHPDWIFLKYGPKDKNNQPTPPEGADFALRAYGGKCGFIQTKDLHTLRPKSWHFIKSNIDAAELMRRFTNLDYSNSNNTARQNSIGKHELIQLYIQWVNSELQ